MWDTRYETLRLRDLWLEGKFYNVIPLSFEEEQSGNQRNLMRNRRPSVQHNFPRMLSDLCARKLFAGRHVPRLKHKDPAFLLKVQALVEELKMPVKMLEAIKRGSVGSVLVLFKFLTVPVGPDGITVKGVVEIKQTQYCTPKFNRFEELVGVLEHYIVDGSELLSRDLNYDREGQPVESNKNYWFLKYIDTNSECTYLPIEEHDWNPMNSGCKLYQDGPSLIPAAEPYVHNMGFLQGVWIKNLTGGRNPEGNSTWDSALNNFIEIDYVKSQNDRGLKYGSAPQIVVKGDFRAEQEGDEAGDQSRDPSFIMRLASDTKDGMGTDSSGHDAFLLETNGAAAKASDDFVRQLKQNSLEQLTSARKDMESIKGAVSGKVIELMDEDYLDMLEELKLMYIDYGYLPLTKKQCKAAAAAGHSLMVGATDQLIDGLEVECPPFYLPDAQDIQLMVQGMVEASSPKLLSEGGGGEQAPTTVHVPPLILPEVAAQFIHRQLDLVEHSEDRAEITGTKPDLNSMPDPQPNADEVAGGSAMESGIVDALLGGRVGS